MKLVNQTPVVADVQLSQEPGCDYKSGMLLAKATFGYDPTGRVWMIDQDPIPLYKEDEQTELGLLPGDYVPRDDPAFEVIVLGAAYSGRGPAPRRPVTLTVGEVTRQIMVFGDRTWNERRVGSATIGAPVPFTRIPLTYEFAFGGSVPANLDMDTVMDIEDRMNKYGRGFDATKLANDLAAAFKAPAGFPFLKYERPLPNLENPAALIQDWNDAPDPHCWATIPTDIGFMMSELIHHFEQHKWPLGRDRTTPMMYQRAHPDWIIDVPPAGAPIIMKGLHPEVDAVTFGLPQVRVLADFELGERTGTRELVPHMLMLLPDEQRFYIVYRHHFKMKTDPEMERSFRLRIEGGWYAPPSENQGGTA
ncbi:MAG: DUF2169 domain-containing protein [Nannocystaceae bacterium]|nr:DUF2169 domain-containing protein [Nannocystaceae bacterium]